MTDARSMRKQLQASQIPRMLVCERVQDLKQTAVLISHFLAVTQQEDTTSARQVARALRWHGRTARLGKIAFPPEHMKMNQ